MRQPPEELSNQENGTQTRRNEDCFPDCPAIFLPAQSRQSCKKTSHQNDVSNFTPAQGRAWRLGTYDEVQTGPQPPKPETPRHGHWRLAASQQHTPRYDRA